MMKQSIHKLFGLLILVMSGYAALAMRAPQKVAYLSWGSLVANPGSLPLEEPDGFKSNPRTGPTLRVDYVRQSNDGRLTLVIAPGYGKMGADALIHEFKTFYATFKGAGIDQARAALQAREGTSAENIGYVDLQENTYRRKDYNALTGKVVVYKGVIGDTYYANNPMLQRIVDWAQQNAYGGVVWTDLPPTFTKANLTLANLKAHLDGLDKEALKRAYCYFKITPEEIRSGTRFGEPLMNYAADHLQNFFDENPQDLSIQQCKDIIYQQR